MTLDELKESDKERMGIEPSAYLARVWGVSTRRIELWRRDLGIISPKELFRGLNKEERLKAEGWPHYFARLEALHRSKMEHWSCKFCNSKKVVAHVGDDSYAECTSCGECWVD